jgi:hypothetical protein
MSVPSMDELPSLLDDALRITEQRLTVNPGWQLYESIAAQLRYVGAVVRGERARDDELDDKLLLDLYAAREFETSDPPFSDLLASVHYLYKRWSPPRSRGV